MSKQLWREIPGFPGYHASRCGKIRGPKGRVLSPWTCHPVGYPHLIYYKVGLQLDGKRIRRFVHRLVCLTFNGEAPPGYNDCAHLDHDTANNNADNLVWSTHIDNCRERYSEEAAEARAVREEQNGELADTNGHIDDVPF